MQKPGIVLHHPGDRQSTIDANLGKSLIESWRRYHMSLGWGDVGYHYIVHRDTDGKVKTFDGRPDSWLGAHTYGSNDWLGVNVAYGNGTKVPQDLLEETAKLIATLCKTYNIPIDANHIKGHREMPGHSSNECPGDDLMNKKALLIQMAKNINTKPFTPTPAKKPQPKENHFSEIEVVFQNEKGNAVSRTKGLLIDNYTHIHVSELKKLGFEVKWVAPADGKPARVEIKKGD